MAKPQFIQQLRHGKLITQANFPQFVETWNYAVNRLDNIKGDFETQPEYGHIKVDNTDPEHPVIRFMGKIPTQSGGSEACPGNFDYYDDEDGKHQLRGGYIMVGRNFYWVDGTEITLSGLISLSCSMQYPYQTAVLQGGSALSSSTTTATFVPLWMIGSAMSAEYDYRHTPVIQRWE